jgi:integration host factor subunit alpha
MTKAEIVQALYTRVGGFSKKESADIVDLVFEMMKETLGKGEKIKISGFGNFVLRDKRQRPGRNPQTGDPIKISERRVLTFKASQILKQALNARPSAASAPKTDGAGARTDGAPALHSTSNGNPESVPRPTSSATVGTSTNEATSTLASGPKE